MNRDNVFRFAQEAGFSFRGYVPELERFASLVAAAERAEMKLDGIHTCHDKCERPVCVAIREAVAAEREACAKVCEEQAGTVSMFPTAKDARNHNDSVKGCAAAIRARGQA